MFLDASFSESSDTKIPKTSTFSFDKDYIPVFVSLYFRKLGRLNT